MLHTLYMNLTGKLRTGSVLPCEGQSDDSDHDQFQDKLVTEMPHLKNYALSLTRDSSEASDLVQDCILRTLENRDGFRDGAHLRRWLFTVIRNRYLDLRRRRVRRGCDVTLEHCEVSRFAQPAPQDAWMEIRECRRRLCDIRPSDRNVLLLCVFSRLSNGEIAEHLEIAEGTVRSRLSRRRARVKVEHSLADR